MPEHTIQFQTKEVYVYNQLRRAILECRYPPGEKLVIDHLSQELGTSHIPVRAALQRLEAEGLVVLTPHAGASVAPLPPEKVNEIFILLETLERVAFPAAALAIDMNGLQSLEMLVSSMDVALATNDMRDWGRLNIAFHRKIAELSGMPLLVEFTRRALDEWERLSTFYFSQVQSKRLPVAQEEHRQILALLRAGSAERLVELASQHNREANRAYQAMLKKKKI